MEISFITVGVRVFGGIFNLIKVVFFNIKFRYFGLDVFGGLFRFEDLEITGSGFFNFSIDIFFNLILLSKFIFNFNTLEVLFESFFCYMDVLEFF